MWARALILPPATLLKNRSMSHIVLPRTRTEPYCGMMTSVVCEGVMTRFSTHSLDKNDELTVDLSTAFDSLRPIVLIKPRRNVPYDLPDKQKIDRARECSSPTRKHHQAKHGARTSRRFYSSRVGLWRGR